MNRGQRQSGCPWCGGSLVFDYPEQGKPESGPSGLCCRACGWNYDTFIGPLTKEQWDAIEVEERMMRFGARFDKGCSRYADELPNDDFYIGEPRD